MTAALKGREEARIWTKPLRPLTEKTSHGFACIAFAEMVLGLRLMPWQKWLLIHALELREDGTYRFRTVIVLVARQNGKTLLMLILALWHIYALESRTVIGTAQDLANAEKAWAEAVEMAQGEPELEELIEKISLAHPKSLKVRPSEDVLTEYRVASANRRGARGFSGDLVLLDELREHQSWDSWASATKTTLARPKAQVWAFSNAGDALSIVLRFLRASAHQALDWPDGDGDRDVLQGSDEDFAAWEEEIGNLGEDSLGLFEWSAPPKSKRSDREAWAQANPSMNHTDIVENCITERAIAAALRTDPPHVFEVEVLCRWLNTASAGPFPEGKWMQTSVTEGRFSKTTPRVICVDVSSNRSRTVIARAGWMDDGVPLVDIAADRPGTDWVIGWLTKNRQRFAGIVVQSNGAPVTSLLVDIEAAVDDRGMSLELPVLKWAGADLGSAFGLLFDRLEASIEDDQRVRHLPHPGMDMAAGTAIPKILAQGAVVLDRAKSPVDVAPLTAAIGALWGLTQVQDAPVESYYARPDAEVMTL